MCSYHKNMPLHGFMFSKFRILIRIICNHVVVGTNTKTNGIPVVENKNKNEGKPETTLESHGNNIISWRGKSASKTGCRVPVKGKETRRKPQVHQLPGVAAKSLEVGCSV